MVHSENWLVYCLFNTKSRRYELTVLEMYDGYKERNRYQLAIETVMFWMSPGLLYTQKSLVGHVKTGPGPLKMLKLSGLGMPCPKPSANSEHDTDMLCNSANNVYLYYFSYYNN